MTTEDLNALEVWESLTDSRVWWAVTDGYGRKTFRSVASKGKRVRIKVADRIANMELGSNPFTNGKLGLVQENKVIEPSQHTDEQLLGTRAVTDGTLLAILKMRSPRIQRELAALEEVNLTRLGSLIGDDTSRAAADAVSEEIKRRHPGEQSELYSQLRNF